jgi:5'-deoxynucleotidase YfbR-like HD superfamily hydrolase
MKILDFAFLVGKLKNLKRSGWLRMHIPHPESVAEHSFRLALLAMILATKVGADSNKAVKMALIHDLGEAIIGDIVAIRGKTLLSNLSEKRKKERKAIESILSLVDAQEYVALYNEFENNKTKEAKLVKQLDKLEMGIQAFE